MTFFLLSLQSDEIDGTTLESINGRNSQSNIDAINRQLNLTLPATPPSGLSQQQLKRRHIFAAIVSSECSYVATLQRLVNVSLSLYIYWKLKSVPPFRLSPQNVTQNNQNIIYQNWSNICRLHWIVNHFKRFDIQSIGCLLKCLPILNSIDVKWIVDSSGMESEHDQAMHQFCSPNIKPIFWHNEHTCTACMV